MATGGSGCRGAHGAVLAERACRWSTAGGKVVAIDPGHNPNNWKHLAEIDTSVPAGGFLKACDTTGTESADGYTEAAFNVDVATRLAHILKAAGATVGLTRTAHTLGAVHQPARSDRQPSWWNSLARRSRSS